MADGDVPKLSDEISYEDSFDAAGGKGRKGDLSQTDEPKEELPIDSPISIPTEEVDAASTNEAKSEIIIPEKPSASKELVDEDGWLQVLGNDQIMKKVCALIFYFK